MREKTIHLLMDDGDLAVQDQTELFLLSEILEDFIFVREHYPAYSAEVEVAKRLHAFIWSDNFDYYSK